MQTNSPQSLLAEYSATMAKSRAAPDKVIPGRLARRSERLPAILIDSYCQHSCGQCTALRDLLPCARHLMATMNTRRVCNHHWIKTLRHPSLLRTLKRHGGIAGHPARWLIFFLQSWLRGLPLRRFRSSSRSCYPHQDYMAHSDSCQFVTTASI